MPSDGFNSGLLRRTMVALLLLVALAPAAKAWTRPIAGERKHDFKRQVLVMEEQWRVAQLAGDVSTMDRLLSDDYVGITMMGQVVTKAQQLNRVRQHELVLTRLDLEETKVKLFGQVAIVTVRAAVAGTNDGKPVDGNFRYTRIYQRAESGGWKITNFEATRIPRHHEGVMQTAMRPS